MIQTHKRIKQLNAIPVNKQSGPVIYVMSRDQRVEANHALYHAQEHALEYQHPLIVTFNLLNTLEFRTSDHFTFMLQGLNEVANDLEKLNIPFYLLTGNPRKNLKKLISELKPSALYFDFSPLRNSRHLKNQLAKDINIPTFEVDTHNIIPVWITSQKQEYAARTIRPKIHRLLNEYLTNPPTTKKHPYPAKPNFTNWSKLSTKTDLPYSFKSGPHQAKKVLSTFVNNRLATYHQDRNQPSLDGQSDLSPYLHFGQISSLTVALAIKTHKPSKKTQSYKDSVDAFIEELVVRKELTDNYCYYNQNYDNLQKGAPNWALKTLDKHRKDKREYTYTKEEFEQAKTHDKIWNAAQNQMVKSGKMHGYLRMYWAKKILEWTPDPETALNIAIELNDSYSIDGYDPNGYVGIMWSIAGLHDRPWFERDIFGTVRYMSGKSLAKKFNIKPYLAKWGDTNQSALL